jgi:hypothetical protein
MSKNLKQCRQKTRRIANLHHFYADPSPDPAFYFNADPDPASHQSDANLRPLTETSGLHFEPPGLHCKRPRLLNIDFNADLDPALHLKRILDPDPALKKMCVHADPDPQAYKGAISGTITISKKINKSTLLHDLSA